MSRRPEWASDAGLYHRLRDAVVKMARGKGSYSERMRAIATRFMEVSIESYPDEVKVDVQLIHALIHSCMEVYPASTLFRMQRLTPSQRAEFADAMVRVFEAMVEDRARLRLRNSSN